MHDSCEYIVANPGKRFRASVLFDASRYGPRPDREIVEKSAVAVELFHSATLAHDDVVDSGQLRRGKATIGAHAGNLAAGLAGGWMFARSIELISEVGEEAVSRFGEVSSVVCEGEILEICDLHDPGRTKERYMAAIAAKTASLIAFAAWLGAKAGCAEPEAIGGLDRYGEAVGMAFQISDDILDLVADPERTGKTPGSDLRLGTYTLPVIYAAEADASLRDDLRRGPSKHELGALVDRIRATGAIEAALADCVDWVERAQAALPRMNPDAEHERRLSSLATSVVGRLEGLAVQ